MIARPCSSAQDSGEVALLQVASMSFEFLQRQESGGTTRTCMLHLVPESLVFRITVEAVESR